MNATQILESLKGAREDYVSSGNKIQLESRLESLESELRNASGYVRLQPEYKEAMDMLTELWPLAYD